MCFKYPKNEMVCSVFPSPYISNAKNVRSDLRRTPLLYHFIRQDAIDAILEQGDHPVQTLHLIFPQSPAGNI
jgi:hypothetical protein